LFFFDLRLLIAPLVSSNSSSIIRIWTPDKTNGSNVKRTCHTMTKLKTDKAIYKTLHLTCHPPTI
jgi:hypothetical protein